MRNSDGELLRRYTKEQSEDAFAELVSRHLDWVHSSALRQVYGDRQIASDVAQGVFIDLARKAPQLLRHPSLTGWLHTSTRYLAANARRGEERRRQREQHAHAMNPPPDSAGPEPDWMELQPVLDATLHELPAADREAVLWRYFERQSHAEIGARLGLSEDAARMRVDRALDKLRASLARRGVGSATAALGAVLTQRASAAAPAELADQIRRAVRAVPPVPLVARPLTRVRQWAIPALVCGLVFLATVPLVRTWLSGSVPGVTARRTSTAAASLQPSGTTAAAGANEPGTGGTAVGANRSAVAEASVNDGPSLLLTVVTAERGEPLGNVPLAVFVRERDQHSRRTLVTQPDGTCRVYFSTNTTLFRLTTEAEGYIATRLAWEPQRGEAIPPDYTLRLGRPVRLGGTVVDADGHPVAGAKVGFDSQEDPALARRPESHEFGWIEVKTDPSGRWEIHRIADDMVRRIQGGASHPEYLSSKWVQVGDDAAAENALRKGSHVFHLGRGMEVSGVVVDAEGNPIAGAKAAVGPVGSSDRRETTTREDGSFVLKGCPAGESLLSGQAKGFAPTTQRIDIQAAHPSYRLVLKPGKTLRLRLVDRDSQPVAGGHAWLNTFLRGPIDPSNPAPPPVQAEVDLRSDAEGRMVWEEAPDAALTFDFEARGYMRVSDFQVRPDDQEHTVELPSALTVFGTVRDKETGDPIPQFRMVTGWPRPAFGINGSTTNADWSTLDRFWMSFAGGEFRHTYEEAVVGGIPNPGYILKFEAEGYSPFISRTIGPAEGEVRLDVPLQRSAETIVTVATPGGGIARQAEVALLGPGAKASFDGHSFNLNSSPGMVRVKTDAQGTFRLPGDNTLERVILVHDSGFLDMQPAEGRRLNTWVLQAWGGIEGQWMTGDQPVAQGEVSIQGNNGPEGAFQLDFTKFRLLTDAEGHFRAERVPPGKVKVVRLHRQDLGGGHTSWSHGKSVDVEVKPGEITPVKLGNAGWVVSVQLQWPSHATRRANDQIMGGVHTALPAEYAEALKNPQVSAQLRSSPEFQQFVSSMKRSEFSIRGNVVSAEEVEPGDYEVVVMVMTPPAPNGTVEGPRLVGRTRVTVPAEPASGKLDLGELMLETPNAGQKTP